MPGGLQKFFLTFFLTALPLLAGPYSPGRYILFLDDRPVAEQLARQGQPARAGSPQSAGIRQNILAKQATLRAALQDRGYHVNGAVQHVLNAVFVSARPDQVAELRSLPHVREVVPVRRFKIDLNAAVNLVNAPAAWNMIGSVNAAGAGVKIAIIDSGIDTSHPGFQDSSLAMPPGFPRCAASDCQFTNSKVIVARSYVSYDESYYGSGPAYSRPDDTSARDLLGHGTNTACIAGCVTNTGPLATITGLAPKAYLGNYKVFGSNEINGFASNDSMIHALDDAVTDGMNIANMSIGGLATSAAEDTGSVCGIASGVPCDPLAAAVENAIASGMLVCVAAGNDNGSTNKASLAARGSIESPGTAPDAITVAATTNSHFFNIALLINGTNVPSNLKQVQSSLGADENSPAVNITAPLADVSKVGDTLACSGFPAGSLAGAMAIIQRGTCKFTEKIAHAAAAGAAAVLFTNNAGDNSAPNDLIFGNQLPALVIGASDGDAVRSYLASNAGATATLPANGYVEQSQKADQIASFSSLGPVIGQRSLKPDMAAVGTDMYMAAQSYDPYGQIYSPSRYIAESGTSYATPMVAGAAALVKQAHPVFTPAQIKSALVNTANRTITGASGATASVIEMGSGRLDAAAALATNVTIEPATISFGDASGLPLTRPLKFTNFGTSSVTLTLTLNQTVKETSTTMAFSSSSVTIPAGGSQTVTVSMTGKTPSPGLYEGAIEVAGGPVPLHVPYIYGVSDGIEAQAYSLSSNEGLTGQTLPGDALFRAVDQYGISVPKLAVTWTKKVSSEGSFANGSTTTDLNGLAASDVTLGTDVCTANTTCFDEFQALIPGDKVTFPYYTMAPATITAGGVVDAASFQLGPGIVPGSYISIFGSNFDWNLSGVTSDAAAFAQLPLSLDGVFVSFDGNNISVPGRMYFLTKNQLNIQVPWELQGQSSVQMKVTIDNSPGPLITVPVAQANPQLFSYKDASSNTIAAALNGSYQLISNSNPATRSQIVQLYANGLGPVSNAPATGQPAPASPLAQSIITPTVTIGGQPAVVQFSGLAPGFVGLYQLNVTVPANIGTGLQPVVVQVNGAKSANVSLPVN